MGDRRVCANGADPACGISHHPWYGASKGHRGGDWMCRCSAYAEPSLASDVPVAAPKPRAEPAATGEAERQPVVVRSARVGRITPPLPSRDQRRRDAPGRRQLARAPFYLARKFETACPAVTGDPRWGSRPRSVTLDRTGNQPFRDTSEATAHRFEGDLGTAPAVLLRCHPDSQVHTVGSS